MRLSQGDKVSVIKSRYKGTAVLTLPQSHVRGILHTIDMVGYLPSLWDCGIRKKLVPLQRDSNSKRLWQRST